jgi:hypothetical protein
MKGSKPGALAAFLAVAILVPTAASAQASSLPEKQCVTGFLSACATLHYIDFSGTWGGAGNGVLRFMVSNTSDPISEANAYIEKLIFDFTGTLPDVQPIATATYSDGQTEAWNVKKSQKTVKGLPGFSLDLEVKDNASDGDGGNKGLRIFPQDAAVIEVHFQGSLAGVDLACNEGPDCQAWSAKMKGLGADKKGSGYTTTPEPGTFLLLATGIIGLAGVQTVRRRRRRDPAA